MKRSRTLDALRDALPSKLISGELRIPFQCSCGRESSQA